MKKKMIGVLLLSLICLAGCGKSKSDETISTKEAVISTEEDQAKTEMVKSENNADGDKFDYRAEITDLRIGDTVCVESMGPEAKLQYKVTLNAVEYAESEINGFDGAGDDFIIVDITLEGVGPDVSFGVILTQLYLGRSTELTPEQQANYGLNTFADAEEVLSEGEIVTGKLAVRYQKSDLTVEKRGMGTTKYIYTVDESEIKDYVPGEQ